MRGKYKAPMGSWGPTSLSGLILSMPSMPVGRISLPQDLLPETYAGMLFLQRETLKLHVLLPCMVILARHSAVLWNVKLKRTSVWYFALRWLVHTLLVPD